MKWQGESLSTQEAEQRPVFLEIRQVRGERSVELGEVGRQDQGQGLRDQMRAFDFFLKTSRDTIDGF